jgi:hypothetical protein
MFDLLKSQVVTKSLKTYEFRIKRIKDITIKNTGMSLLQDLKKYILDLEQAHKIKNAGDLRPNVFDYHREKIYKIRKKLDQLIKEN